jgi:succinoglycan biosynthesis protein ExoM
MSRPKPTIDVCIATYKRPDLLRRLLESIVSQETDDLFDVRIVIADNDAGRSAEAVARALEARGVPVVYDVEPVQSISHARNKSLSHAKGDFVAITDDDNYADTRWLFHLYRAALDYEADVVHGSGERVFEPGTPQYILESTAWVRPNPPTGSTEGYVCATGNCMFRRDLVRDVAVPFDPEFGRTGSEDVAFFERLRRQGAKFVWCREAKIFGYVPPERANWRWVLKRDFRTGNTHYRVYDRGPVDPASPTRVKVWRLSRLVVKRSGAALFPVLRGLYDARARLDAIERLRSVAFFAGIIAHLVGVRYEEYRGR